MLLRWFNNLSLVGFLEISLATSIIRRIILNVSFLEAVLAAEDLIECSFSFYSLEKLILRTCAMVREKRFGTKAMPLALRKRFNSFLYFCAFDKFFHNRTADHTVYLDNVIPVLIFMWLNLELPVWMRALKRSIPIIVQ